MSFEFKKQETLNLMYEEDASKKSYLDSRIVPIIQMINEHPDYYTTSSCSGRIYIIERNMMDNKYIAKWLYMSHELANPDHLVEALRHPSKSEIWFKQEGPIIHIACRDTDAAHKMLTIIRDAGYKRAGAFNLDNNPIVEFISSEQFEVPLAHGGKRVITDDYLHFLTLLANNKLTKAWKRMDNFKHKLSEL